MKRQTARQYAQALRDACSASPADERPAIIRRFLHLLRRRRAMKMLPRIMHQLALLEDAAAGITRVRAWSARQLDAGALEAALRPALGATAVQASVDPSLIGGLKLQIGDHLIDGSLRARLQRLLTHLGE